MPIAVDMTETVPSLSNFWEKHDGANCGSLTFPVCVTEHVSDSLLSSSNHKPMQRGESAPVCVKNRTWYYRGISKRPVKIKGFREVLRLSFGHCQHFFGVCCLMWLVKTVSHLKSNTSRLYSRKNDWKGAWKSEAHSRSQTRTLVLYVHLNITDKHLCLTSRLQMLLMVYLNSKCLQDPLTKGSFTSSSITLEQQKFHIAAIICISNTVYIHNVCVYINRFKLNIIWCFWKTNA